MKNNKAINDDFITPLNIATVVDNQDENNSSRVKVRVPTIHDNIEDEFLPWAAKLNNSFLGYGGTAKQHAIPEVGTKLLVMFVSNNPNSVIYLGSLEGQDTLTPTGDDYTGTYGIYTQDGDFIGVDKLNSVLKLVYTGKMDISNIEEMSITVKGNVDIKAQQANVEATTTSITGNASITGNLQVEGIISSPSVTATTVTVGATAISETTAALITNHVHTAPSGGGVTTGPVAP